VVEVTVALLGDPVVEGVDHGEAVVEEGRLPSGAVLERSDDGVAEPQQGGEVDLPDRSYSPPSSETE